MNFTMNADSLGVLGYAGLWQGIRGLFATTLKMLARPGTSSSNRCISAIAHGFNLAAKEIMYSMLPSGSPVRLASSVMLSDSLRLPARSETVCTHRRTSARDSLHTASPCDVCVCVIITIFSDAVTPNMRK